MSKHNVLSNGILILGVNEKIKNLARLSITDLYTKGRVIFDLEKRIVIGDDLGLKFSDADYTTVQNFIKAKEAKANV